MSLIYLDTETTGLDPARHHIWEMAYAVDGGPILSAVVPHTTIGADPDALRIGKYEERGGYLPADSEFDRCLATEIEGETLVAANPAFDAAFLRARWGKAPWKYRLLDVEAYAMGALGYDVPQGLKTIAHDLRAADWDIPEPNHSAAGDVATLRDCHLALRAIYADVPAEPSDQGDNTEEQVS